MAKTGVIYKIENPTGKIYIGKAICFSSRMSAYRNLNCKDQKALYASLVKYGFENHKVEILFEGFAEILAEKEIEFIEIFNSYSHYNPNGLNLTLGGDGALGRVYTKEQREAVSKRNTGKKYSEESKKRMSNSAKLRCDETFKARISKISKGNKYAKGRTRSEKEKEEAFKTRVLNKQRTHGNILQYNLEGKLIKIWVPIYSTIAKEMKCHPSTIRTAVLSNASKPALGFNWKYSKK